jgi:hypothetical protein
VTPWASAVATGDDDNDWDKAWTSYNTAQNRQDFMEKLKRDAERPEPLEPPKPAEIQDLNWDEAWMDGMRNGFKPADNAMLEEEASYSPLDQPAETSDEEGIKDLREMFAALDTNNDGTLSVDEMRQGMAKAGILDIPGNWLEIMDEVDTDGNGVIDYTEFLAEAVRSRNSEGLQTRDTKDPDAWQDAADAEEETPYPLPDEGPVFTVPEGMAEDAPLHEQLAFLARQRTNAEAGRTTAGTVEEDDTAAAEAEAAAKAKAEWERRRAAMWAPADHQRANQGGAPKAAPKGAWKPPAAVSALGKAFREVFDPKPVVALLSSLALYAYVYYARPTFSVAVPASLGAVVLALYSGMGLVKMLIRGLTVARAGLA